MTEPAIRPALSLSKWLAPKGDTQENERSCGEGERPREPEEDVPRKTIPLLRHDHMGICVPVEDVHPHVYSDNYN